MVYIDGFNLYHGMHDATSRAHLWLDFVALARSIRPRSALKAVKYFTAPVLDDPPAASRQAHHQAAVCAKYPTLFHVKQGRYQSKNVTCFGCGRVHTVREEKETDVNIAVSIVADVAQGTTDSVIVISADSDLAPAVRIARELRPGMFIAAAFPPRRSSSELRALMPHSFQLGQDKIRKAQLPDSFTIHGTTYTRPPKWA